MIAFFNNKGGVGKTSLVYHLAWMLADLGNRVVAADLDPQANLTSAFLDEEQLEELWTRPGPRQTVWGSIQPFHAGEGGIAPVEPTPTAEERLKLLPGDLDLSSFEDDLSSAWPKCLDGDARSFQVISAFWTIVQEAARAHRADLVLVDVGPSLGAINRAALVASDHVVVPVAPDLFSLQGLRNLGPALRSWRSGWQQRLTARPSSAAASPAGRMNALGYVVLQHGIRLDRPIKAYQRWMDEIPREFRSAVLGSTGEAPAIDVDPQCLGQLKHYHGLMPLAQEARKPIFHLTSADGAFGGHFQAALDAYGHFEQLARRIAAEVRAQPPSP
ncbi:cellulose biosynthesis protein BcsQ [Saccharothrix coeruleofusca]|uniref:ParA family protein n=1 Tax=Saccharothrix coeruleofusca TaxID=33919 RepID=UPI001AE244B6|nr:ParA family protein [Saccharothrix coeruleofusca]MBP2338696.1 cellulose biosynthesis protein BcsQ [Saccharothrix coeruleofusca]